MKLVELEKYFNSIELPTTLQLNEGVFLNDVRQCVDSNISFLVNNPGNRCYLPYYDQLIAIKEKLDEYKQNKARVE